MEEIWVDVKDYEGLYQVSNCGRIKSLERYEQCGNHLRIRRERILKPIINDYGYIVVNLFKKRKITQYQVHRLVAEAFIPNPYDLPEVNHKDEDTKNNSVFNLEWCTHYYNINYGTRTKRATETQLNRKDSSKTVLQYTTDGQFVKEYPSVKEAARQNGFNFGHIASCCRGEIKTSRGYIWRYKNMFS